MPSLSSSVVAEDVAALERAAPTVVLAAGGTGGHIIPGIAIANELRARGHETLFVGTPRGMESRLVPPAGFALRQLRIGALNQVSWSRRLRTLAQLPLSVMDAWRLLAAERARVAVSLGGYAAGPLLVAARLRGVPIVVVEPNAVPGLAHRWTRRWVRRALVAFEAAAQAFPAGKARITGVPVRGAFHELAAPVEPPPFTVLITGGSQGARRLNQAAVDAAEIWKKRGDLGQYRLVHQTGVREHKEIESRYRELGVDAEATPFVDDMPAAFGAAHVIVCRAGASTVSEVAAAGKASVLAPFPFAADDHQLRNAEALASRGAARLVLDAEMNGERLVKELDALRADASARQAMESRAREFARPAAAREIVDEILEAALSRK